MVINNNIKNYFKYKGEYEVTDYEIIQIVKSGKSSAFDILVRKYESRIVHIAQKYVKNESDAEDIKQETFIKAYNSLNKFRNESAFYTWLYRIAINTAKNHLITMKRRPSGSSVDFDVSELDAMIENNNIYKSETPEQILCRDELEDLVMSTIESLQDDLKRAITLREFEGMSYEDIANEMQCPIGTVRSRIFRAREIINTSIQDLLYN